MSNFRHNFNYEQNPNYTRNTETIMYTEEKSSDPDAGGIECILDRKQEDIDRIKYLVNQINTRQITPEEWEEYSKPMKGALNYADLDRIEFNLGVLQNLFAPYITINYYSMSRDYIPRTPYFVNLLKNIQLLRDTMYILSTTPRVPSLPLSKFKDWNDIEQIIYDVYWMYRRFERSFYYCDTEIYSGGNFLI